MREASVPRNAGLEAHVRRLKACRRCPRMQPPPVSGGAVASRVILVGQAPGTREPIAGKPFAWTAGRTLFGWFEKYGGIGEEEFRRTVYMAAVCRCFPGKTAAGGDRVPAPDEVKNCATWLDAEISLLRPGLIIPVGKLAISQFVPCDLLSTVIGESYPSERAGVRFDVIPLPHPSGASPWHRMEPGRSLLETAMKRICKHRVFAGRV